MHRRARERREGGLTAVTESSADRWEGLTEVKVQARDNMIPQDKKSTNYKAKNVFYYLKNIPIKSDFALDE